MWQKGWHMETWGGGVVPRAAWKSDAVGLVLAVATAIWIAVPASRVVAQTPTPAPATRTVSLPSNASVAVGSMTTVPLSIDAADGVLGYDISISYDCSVVSATGLAKTTFTNSCTLGPLNAMCAGNVG